MPPAANSFRKTPNGKKRSVDAIWVSYTPLMSKRFLPPAAVASRHVAAVTRACRLLDASGSSPDLNALARGAGMSASHFHRVFKDVTGLTPKAYASAARSRRVRDILPHSDSVTEAMYRSGFQSSGRFYEGAAGMLGMTPSAYRSGGDGTVIRFAVGECSLGSFLVAASAIGVCCIMLDDDPLYYGTVGFSFKF